MATKSKGGRPQRATTTLPAKTGRPQKPIDPEQVKKLAAIDCSYAEIAAIVGCDPSTLTRRFAQAIREGRDQGNASLKRKQYERAMGGSDRMLIWLGKQRLGQREQVEHSGPNGGDIPHKVAVTRRVVYPDGKVANDRGIDWAAHGDN